MSRRPSDREGVDVSGPEDAEPVLLVHGAVFNRTMWAPQREALSEKFRVLVPDLPGHGTRADEPFRMQTAVRTLDRLVESLPDESVHVVGLSLGGYVATAFARQQADKVDDLVLSSSSVNPVGLSGVLSKVVGNAAILASKSGVVERATDWLAERYVRSRDIGPEAKAEVVDAGFDLRALGEAGVEIAGNDFRGALETFPKPTLVLNGKWDLLMRLGEREHAEAVHDGYRSVIDGAGHVCNLDDADAYTSAIDRFADATAEASPTD